METIRLITSMVHFTKVVQLSSFSKAASSLGMSKAHLSKSIQKLETHLNTLLLHRTTRSVRPTSFGKFLYETCQNHTSELETIALQVSQTSKAPSGTIRVTLAGAYGEEVITPLLSKLQIRYPNIRIELLFEESILNLEEEDIDLAIRVSAKKPRDGHATLIGKRKELVCATYDFLKMHGVPQQPNDLKKMNCLTGRNGVWVFEKNKKALKVKVEGTLKCSNGRSLVQASLSNLGIVKLPEVYVRKYIEENKLIPVLEDYTQDPISIWAVTNKNKEAHHIIQLALQELIP